MRRLAFAVLCALLLAPAATAAAKPKLTKAKATAILVADPKVADWLKHYPPKTRTTEATFKDGAWTVKIWTSIDSVGEVPTGKVDDASRKVTEAWTGPQVAWQMARGHDGAFGGREINSARVWLGLFAGFRIGLNVEDSNVIDVGYSGVVGADRIAHGQSPYGHFPVEEKLKACGPADTDGEIRDRIQTNGRCESANPQGDTYGPVAYETYLPGYWLFGWTGKWDDLPAAHFASVVFDVLSMIGLALVGLRFGGVRLAATLAFAWAAWPFTQYVSSSNTNDALPPLFLIWGFWLVTSAVARGAFTALAGWTKFAPLVVAPLWASYPEALDRPRQKLVFAGAFLVATVAAFSILL